MIIKIHLSDEFISRENCREEVSIYDTGFPELVDVICTYGTYVIRICMNGMSSEFCCCCNIRVSQGEFF